MRLTGVSRTQRTSFRPSFSITSAARATRSSLMPLAIAPSVPIEHGMAENAARELLQVAGSNAQLFRKEPLPGFRDHQMNTADARVLFKQYQRLLRQNRSAGPGHTYGDNLFLRVSHVFCAGRISLAAAFRQVKLRQSSSAMIEFAAAGEYESK